MRPPGWRTGGAAEDNASGRGALCAPALTAPIRHQGVVAQRASTPCSSKWSVFALATQHGDVRPNTAYNF